MANHRAVLAGLFVVFFITASCPKTVSATDMETLLNSGFNQNPQEIINYVHRLLVDNRKTRPSFTSSPLKRNDDGDQLRLYRKRSSVYEDIPSIDVGSLVEKKWATAAPSFAQVAFRLTQLWDPAETLLRL